jgi:hypothetical protein
LFSRIKAILKRDRFQNAQEMRNVMIAALMDVTRSKMPA